MQIISVCKLLATPGLLIFLAASANAATLTFQGIDTTTQADWRTSSVVKPLDPGGDNIYGSDGYFLFYSNAGGFSGNPLENATNSLPSYLSLAANGANFSLNFPVFSDINNPATPTVDIDSGSVGRNAIAQGSEVSLVNLLFAAGAPAAGIRLGILGNISDADNPSAIRLELAGSSGSVTASASVTPAVGANPPAQWFFFDITDISTGDVFTLFATDTVGGAAEIKGIGGFSVDVIPEPSTGALLGLFGLIAMLARRRR